MNKKYMTPKIIHQIWDGEPLSDFFLQLSETWKTHHPTWKYEFWDSDRIEAFVNNNYPHLAAIYFNFQYDMQRWDFIRYLILYKMGGMYVDFDYECLESFDNCLTKDKFYFAIEPELHSRSFGKDVCLNGALMITPPYHPFLECVIAYLETTPVKYTGNKFHDVLYSTGPLMLTNLYEKFEDKSNIHLFSQEQVSPWSKNDVESYINGTANEKILEKKLENAIAIHYYWGAWLYNNE